MTYNPRGQMLRETFGTNTALYHRQYYNRRGQMFDSRLGTDGSTVWDVEDPNVLNEDWRTMSKSLHDECVTHPLSRVVLSQSHLADRDSTTARAGG
jgi:hypothetical protein